eukprot:641104-Prorocentrum_minimum.AAC.1
MPRVCTSAAPRVHIGCPAYAPHVYIGCPAYAPRAHTGCPAYAPRAHICCPPSYALRVWHALALCERCAGDGFWLVGDTVTRRWGLDG